MDMIVNLSAQRLTAIQTRAEYVVHHGRRNGHGWADGAVEFDVAVMVQRKGVDGATSRRVIPGKYMYLGVGRGYLMLEGGWQWRIACGEAAPVQSGSFPHSHPFLKTAAMDPTAVEIVGINDSGAVAYITRCLEDL